MARYVGAELRVVDVREAPNRPRPDVTPEAARLESLNEATYVTRPRSTGARHVGVVWHSVITCAVMFRLAARAWARHATPTIKLPATARRPVLALLKHEAVTGIAVERRIIIMKIITFIGTITSTTTQFEETHSAMIFNTRDGFRGGGSLVMQPVPHATSVIASW